MRLYDEEDVKRASEEKEIRIRELESARAAQRVEVLRWHAEEKERTKAKIKETVSAFKNLPPPIVRHSDVIGLPMDVMDEIVMTIARSIEPRGVRGPCLVVRSIANIGLVCWDFHQCIRRALEFVGERSELESLPVSLCDRVVSDPTSLKLTELKEIARNVGAPVSGTKAEVIINVLRKFGLDRPCRMPSKCLRAVYLERKTFVTFESFMDFFRGVSLNDIHTYASTDTCIRSMFASNFFTFSQ